MLNFTLSSSLPCSDILNFSLTKCTGLSSSHTSIALDGFYIWRSVHDFWELSIQKAQQMFVYLLKF